MTTSLCLLGLWANLPDFISSLTQNMIYSWYLTRRSVFFLGLSLNKFAKESWKFIFCWKLHFTELNKCFLCGVALQEHWVIFLDIFAEQTDKGLNHAPEEVITMVKFIRFAYPVAISYNLPVCIFIANTKLITNHYQQIDSTT